MGGAVNSPEMHLAAAGSTEKPCEHCGGLFTQRRGWGRFCKTKCRNDFHAREARIEAIRARAIQMYEALRKIAEGHNDPIGVNRDIAAWAIKDLKAP